MQKVLVVDSNKKALMPTHPARARKLLKAGKAAVCRRFPFMIILKYAVEEAETQELELKLDPGSKTTGIALVADCKRGKRVVWAANLAHRGEQVKKALKQRRNVRRSRRGRKKRYRQARFLNRKRTSFEYIKGQKVGTKTANNKQARNQTGRPSGWISPCLQSRVDNVYQWSKRLIGLAPITRLEVETVRFDTQKLVNPEISGVEYQQGTLFGYEVREYLLEKWGRKCAYCEAENVPLQIEHIIPRTRRGGSDRVSNLTLACQKCNQEKNNQTAEEYGFPDIQKQAGRTLQDVAAVNATRYAIGRALKDLGLPIRFWTGGRTKFNRYNQGYIKAHWIDAACVGETGANVNIPQTIKPLQIKAMGRGTRQMCRVDKYGFPRTKPKSVKRVHGFQTGDMVKAVVPKGKKAGIHIGRVVVKASGSFRVGQVDGIGWRYCTLLHKTDSYGYKN